ncbi:hypothetical protein G3T14_08880 [Methylobacterium sp. BTF04]|uniref:Pr6Pr family membrane protein n=1 Tax=Methylobacterium sp. BTF04 TaxID=2708300 RepID=UPI0013D36B04|nr:Pr6Pr family membrane protein [Methylobacterium sp. BTF04]NEU12246.1 hypothetical protein [Methylobacterium sp. BTF04]
MRMAAVAIALVAGIGLVIQLVAIVNRIGSLPSAIWEMGRYFTVLTNFLVAILFSGIAAGLRMKPRLIAGITLAILLVGIVYATLLQGLQTLSGGDAVADVLLHWVTPVLVPLFWFAFTPKGGLRPIDPLLWALYPVTYLGYALIRGAAEGRYAYPFIDVPALGWGPVLLNVGAIALGFVATGHACVRIDRHLGGQSSRS